jgi:hypothetical protein
MATALEIKNASQGAKQGGTIADRFWRLIPPVELVSRKNARKYTATILYLDDGKYPNTVHVKELVGWFDAKAFDIAPK